MDKRAAKRLACAWVANLIHAEIMDGGATKVADEVGSDSPEDEQRLADALQELAAELERRGKGLIQGD